MSPCRRSSTRTSGRRRTSPHRYLPSPSRRCRPTPPMSIVSFTASVVHRPHGCRHGRLAGWSATRRRESVPLVADPTKPSAYGLIRREAHAAGAHRHRRARPCNRLGLLTTLGSSSRISVAGQVVNPNFAVGILDRIIGREFERRRTARLVRRDRQREGTGAKSVPASPCRRPPTTLVRAPRRSRCPTVAPAPSATAAGATDSETWVEAASTSELVDVLPSVIVSVCVAPMVSPFSAAVISIVSFGSAASSSTARTVVDTDQRQRLGIHAVVGLLRRRSTRTVVGERAGTYRHGRVPSPRRGSEYRHRP